MLPIALRFFVIVVLISITAHADAEKGLALVVGIDRYDNLPADRNLKKAVGDARAVGAAFSKLGYEIEIGENVSRSEFNRLWARFLDRIAPGDIAAFHFSGHGVELWGSNYLVPGDIPDLADTGEAFLRDESISLNRLLDDLRDKRPRVSYLIVDACRNNPFSDSRGRSLGATRGLSKADPPKGAFVMYSAGTGQAALDRLSESDPDPNSIYTRSLLPLLTTPGLSLADIARRVRTGVRDLALTAGHDQTPAYYDEIVGDYYPAGEKPKEPDAKPVTSAQVPSAEVTIVHAGKNGIEYASAFDDETQIVAGEQIKEAQRRLYEMNYDPGPEDGAINNEVKEAIKEFQGAVGLKKDGTLSIGLLQRLRTASALKPWGAIPYSKSAQKWGMAWDVETRKAAVEEAQSGCGPASGSCTSVLTFFGTECGAFAYSQKRWALVARRSTGDARAAALEECGRNDSRCEVLAAVCANGTDKYVSK